MSTVTVSATLYDQIGQVAHTLAGILVVLGPNALFGSRFMWAWVLALIIFAAVKEFWYDVNYESSDERGNGWEDFGFYIIGEVIGLVLWGLKRCYEIRREKNRYSTFTPL